MSAGDESPALIELGSVGAPFGVRGWVKLRSYTDPPERVFEHRRLQLRRGAWETYRSRRRAQRRSADREIGGVSRIGIRRRLDGRLDRGAARASCRRATTGISTGRFDRLRGGESGGRTARGGAHFVETPRMPMMVVRGQKEYWVPAVPQHLRRVDLKARRSS
jgi:16S rRNA processing protein RimM